MKSNLWLWYLAGVVAAGQYYFVSSVSSEPSSVLYTLIGCSSIVAIVVGAVVHRGNGTRTAGLALLGVAVSLYLAGDYVYAVLAEDSPFVPFPSLADWLYLAMYPVLFVGAWLLARSSPSRRRTGALVDTAVTAVASFAVIGSIYMNDLLTDDTFGTTVRVVSSAYPVLDVVMLALGAWFVASAASSPSPTRTLALAFVAMSVGNVAFNLAAATFSFEPGGLADLCWLGFTSLLGVASLQPPVVEAASTTSPVPTQVRRWVLLALVGSIPAAHLVWGSDDHVVAVVALYLTAFALTLVGVRRAPEHDVACDGSRPTHDLSRQPVAV